EEIERAILDRLDRHRDIAGARDDEDRRRVMLRVEVLEDIEPGLTRHVHIEDYAGRRPRSCGGEKRSALGETRDLIARPGQNDRERVAHKRVIVDDKDFPAARIAESHGFVVLASAPFRPLLPCKYYYESPRGKVLRTLHDCNA